LLIIDVVTSRQGNLHNELMELLGLEHVYQMAKQVSLYCVAYRPLSGSGGDCIETWPVTLNVGQVLPTMPLSLEAGYCVPVDLDAAYVEACNRRRLNEVVG